MKNKLSILIIMSFLLSPFLLMNVQGQNPIPVFYINFLTPNTNPARMQWSLLIEQEIAKIGINVSFNEMTGWGNIGPRTWSYPVGVSYDHIPVYEDGGFDALFVGWSWGLDGNLAGLYETAAITPSGDNFYQFSNSTYDIVFDQYINTTNPSERKIFSHQLQNILLEELPEIGIIYAMDLFGFKVGLTGIDPLLLGSSNFRIENWDDPDDHIIIYGIPADLSEPNIFKAESFYDRQWMNPVYGSPLKRAQGSYLWEVECASSITTEVDYVSETQIVNVSLDPLATFSDGNVVLPEDLKYSYQLHMTPPVGSSLYGYLANWFGDNDSIVIDSTTGNVPGGSVIFNMTRISNFWESLYNIQIIDKSDIEPRIVARGYDIFNSFPGDTYGDGYALVKSCGPLRLDNFNPVTSTVRLLPNTHWHGDPVDLTEFYLTFVSGKDNAVADLLAGTIDIMDGQYYPQWTDFDASNVTGIPADSLIHQGLSINMRHPVMGTGELTPFGTPEAAKKVRQAISCCIPRQTIVDDILNGVGSVGIISLPEGCEDFDNSLSPYPYDISLATTLMEQAGFIITIQEFGNVALMIFIFTGLVTIYVFRKKKR